MKITASDWLKISGLAIIFVGGLVISYFILKPKPALPIYNPSDLDKRLVDESMQRQGRDHHILPFELINQNGDTIREEDLAGKIFVADFFFTSCPGICKDMAGQKRRLQEEFKDDSDFVLLSHSVTPVADSVPVLHEYAELQGAIDGKWQLLTGPKKEIYKLARQSYFAVLDEGGKGDETDFIHTENFVLVDPNKRIRGYYDGTSKEDVDRLIRDIGVLKEEYER